MKVHRRYIATEVSIAILFVLLGFLSLFAFFDVISEVKNIGRGTYRLHHALTVVALRTPGRVYEMMPVAVLIGTLYALSTLARHSEINVLRTSGMSTQSLLYVLSQVALLFAVFTFFVGEVVAPPLEKAAQQLRLKERGRTLGAGLQSGVWVKDGKSFINVRVVLPDSQLRQIHIYEFDEYARLQSVTHAAEGEYQPPASWLLRDVAKTLIKEGRSEVIRQPDMIWSSALNPDILSVLMVRPDRMSILHLLTYIRHLTENNQRTQRYSIALWKKITYPAALLVMAALALPFGYTHNRAGGVSLKVFSGVMIGVLFYMLNGLFSNLGAINSWPPFVSAILPSVLFMMAAISIIWWIERR